MTRLNLTPLPCERFPGESTAVSNDRDGFVDEAVVLALLTGPVQPRQQGFCKDLALLAEDIDFAGWRLPAQRAAQADEADLRRPAPPSMEEPGIGEAHRGSHRWWLAGLAGAMSTLVISALLISLSSRNAQDGWEMSIIRPASKLQHDKKQRETNPPRIAPQLTRVLQDR